MAQSVVISVMWDEEQPPTKGVGFCVALLAKRLFLYRSSTTLFAKTRPVVSTANASHTTISKLIDAYVKEKIFQRAYMRLLLLKP
jgi:hypothetical protein